MIVFGHGFPPVTLQSARTAGKRPSSAWNAKSVVAAIIMMVMVVVVMIMMMMVVAIAMMLVMLHCRGLGPYGQWRQRNSGSEDRHDKKFLQHFGFLSRVGPPGAGGTFNVCARNPFERLSFEKQLSLHRLLSS
jgi:hypothetical protein